jgi:hypothetical protein
LQHFEHARLVEAIMSTIFDHATEDAKRFDHKINIDKHIRDTHVIAAFNDMAMRGTAKFVLRDDGAQRKKWCSRSPGLDCFALLV